MRVQSLRLDFVWLKIAIVSINFINNISFLFCSIIALLGVLILVCEYIALAHLYFDVIKIIIHCCKFSKIIIVFIVNLLDKLALNIAPMLQMCNITRNPPNRPLLINFANFAQKRSKINRLWQKIFWQYRFFCGFKLKLPTRIARPVKAV